MPFTVYGRKAGESDPTWHYKISDLDSAGDTKYFGYVDTGSRWYIMRMTDTEVRYAKGDSSYGTNWTNRASLTYHNFETIF